MSDLGGSSEDQNANRNSNSKDCAHEVLDGNEDSMEIWSRDFMLHSSKELNLHFVHALRFCRRLSLKLTN
jgi:hypothetical protein